MMRFNVMSAAGMLSVLVSSIGVAPLLEATPSRGVEAPPVATQPAGTGPTLVAGTVRQAGRGPQPKSVPNPSNGPWTYLATLNRGAVLIDMGSIRQAGSAEDGGHMEAWVMLMDRNGADVWKVDIDCELKAHRIGHLVREDAERNKIFQAPDAGSWGSTNPGTTFDRLATIMCNPAALPAASGDGPWTYIATIGGRGVFFDKASIRPGADGDGRNLLEAWVLTTDGERGERMKLDLDCKGKAQRLRVFVQEDAERNPIGQDDRVSEWVKTGSGTPGDRIRRAVCGTARN